MRFVFLLNLAIFLLLLTACLAVGQQLPTENNLKTASIETVESDSNSAGVSFNLFEPPIRLTAEGKPIQVELPGYACPTMVDFSGDGVFDLVVGQFANGNMQRFRNLAFAGQPPKFAAGEWLMSGEARAQIPGIRCCTSSTPQFVDWNGDGQLDILSGCYATPAAPVGHIVLLLGQPNSMFSTPYYLTGSQGHRLQNADHSVPGDNQQKLLDSICTHQHAVDLDGDGDMDLVVGASSGRFFWYENIGSGKQPILKQPPIPFPIQSPSSRSAPHLVDWDGDGDLDLITGGSDGGVYLSLNQRTRQFPQWSAFQTLIQPTSHPKQLGNNQTQPGHSSRVWAFDWNGDGMLDLLVGDCVALIRPAVGVSEEHFLTKENELQQKQTAANEIATRLGQISDTDQSSIGLKVGIEGELRQANEELQRLSSLRYQWAAESNTGFVWLYLRKSQD